MLVQFEINGKAIQFGTLPNEEINNVQIRTSGFPIGIQSVQLPQVKMYLKTLVEKLDENGYIIYNGVLNYKNDINLECLK